MAGPPRLWASAAPGVLALISIAASENRKQPGECGERARDLYFVQGPDEAEVSRSPEQVLLQVIVESGFKSETLRILVVDLRIPIDDVLFIRTALVGHNDTGIVIDQQARGIQESQVCRKRSMSVQEAAFVQVEKLAANASPDHDGFRRACVPCDCGSGNSRIQHHTVEGLAGALQHSRGISGVAAPANHNKASVGQWAGVAGTLPSRRNACLNLHEIFRREVDVVAVEEFTHAVQE